jgi:membrane protease subunit HflK
MDFDHITSRLRDGLGKFTGRFGGGGVGLLIIIIIALAAVVWLATGIFQVGPGEQAARRLFGEKQDLITQSGLQWWWPAPVGRTDTEVVTQTRRMELGFISNETGSVAARGEEALMISGDLNIVDVQMVVQYNIKDLNAFLFNVDDPGEETRGIVAGRPDGRTLKDAAEAALRLVVGQSSIDDILVRNREQVEVRTKDQLQNIMDTYDSGIDVISVQLQDVKAPEEVRDAFDDVLRARQERDTRINQARAFEADIIPRAEGDSERIKQGAEAFKQARIARAEGEADRFTSILQEYNKSQEVTRQRLYLEAMEEVLPGITKIILSPEAQAVLILGGDGSLTPVPIGPTP